LELFVLSCIIHIVSIYTSIGYFLLLVEMIVSFLGPVSRTHFKIIARAS